MKLMQLYYEAKPNKVLGKLKISQSSMSKVVETTGYDKDVADDVMKQLKNLNVLDKLQMTVVNMGTRDRAIPKYKIHGWVANEKYPLDANTMAEIKRITRRW